MRTLSKFDLDAISGGKAEGIDWGLAAFDISAFSTLGGVTGAIAGAALTFVNNRGDMMALLLGTCIGAAGGTTLGQVFGAGFALTRECLFA